MKNDFYCTKIKVPPFILIPLAGFTGAVLNRYYYFQDEMPFKNKKVCLSLLLNGRKKAGNEEYRRLFL